MQSSAWVFLALLSAFSLATSDALTKKTLETGNEYLVAWFRLLFSVPLLIAILLAVPVPQVDRYFFAAFVAALPLEVLSVILYIKALRLSPLTLTLPFLSLTPLFVVGVSYGLLGEKVTGQGMGGILLLAAGSYVLNIHTARKGVFSPFRAIVRERGSLAMIGVALIYSVTSTLGKMAILHSSPLFFGASYILALTAALGSIALWKGRTDVGDFVKRRRYKALIVPGFFYAIMVASHMLAMSMTQVAYMISVKRTSVLMGMLYGYVLFRERHIAERMVGAIIMLAGFVLVVTAE